MTLPANRRSLSLQNGATTYAFLVTALLVGKSCGSFDVYPAPNDMIPLAPTYSVV